MSSIIDLFNADSTLSFSYSSTDEYNASYKAEYAISKDTNYFQSNANPAFWQISFSRPVLIEKYIIGGSTTWTTSPTSWDVSYSTDGVRFTFLQTDLATTLIGTKKTFVLKKKITCRSLKITGKTTTTGGIWIAFNQFDCFGSIPQRILRDCTFNIGRYRRFFISNELVIIMTLSLST